MGYYSDDRGYQRDRQRYGGRGERGDHARPARGYGPEQRDDFRERGRDPRRTADDHRGNRHAGRPADYDYDDRGFFERAGDEVRSWFGDEEAERRRELDARHAEREYDRGYGGGTRYGASGARYDNDPDYHHWRARQVAAIDRDYDEYRREKQSRFDNEFGQWRQRRTGQRDSLARVAEHMEVVGRDGEHIGTVDKVRGDRIVLTRSDPDAKGHHHSIPSAWIETVDDRVTVSKTAEEAKEAWRDEERRGALFGEEGDPSAAYAYSRGFIGFY